MFRTTLAQCGYGVCERAHEVQQRGAGLRDPRHVLDGLPMREGSRASEEFIDSLLGERVGGRYVVSHVLGSGGMGLVASARYPELNQQVAIKFMFPEYAADAALGARFLREARLAANVQSPHLVRVFDVGKLPSGIPYLVMEMLSGRDLGAEVRAQGQFGTTPGRTFRS